MAYVHYAYWDRFGRADYRTNQQTGQEANRELGPPAIEAWWVK
jgi:hypothetical protein